MPTYSVWVYGQDDLRPLVEARKIAAADVDGALVQLTTILSNEHLSPAPHHAWIRDDESGSRESLLYGFVREPRGGFRPQLLGSGTMRAG